MGHLKTRKTKGSGGHWFEARDPGHRVGTSTLLGDPCSYRCLTRLCQPGNWGLPGYFPWASYSAPYPFELLTACPPSQ